jgi:hypothetical protein
MMSRTSRLPGRTRSGRPSPARITIYRSQGVFGRRAVHAFLGHLDLRPSWLGLEPGRKLQLPLGLLLR